MTVAVSPCTKICVIGSNGLCLGCMRSTDEIGQWYYLPEKEKREVLKLLENRWRAYGSRL